MAPAMNRYIYKVQLGQYSCVCTESLSWTRRAELTEDATFVFSYLVEIQDL